jgi:hypothetical protein
MELPDKVSPHNVSQTRVILGEAKRWKDLPWEHAVDNLTFHTKNEPTKVFQIILEYHPDTGFWCLYEEWRYEEEYGGQVIQVRSLEELLNQRKTIEKTARDAQNEADAIGGG